SHAVAPLTVYATPIASGRRRGGGSPVVASCGASAQTRTPSLAFIHAAAPISPPVDGRSGTRASSRRATPRIAAPPRSVTTPQASAAALQPAPSAPVRDTPAAARTSPIAALTP